MTIGYTNHIVLVLDASLSMSGLASDVVRVADAEIAHLARRSQELDQETRVTVYAFNDPNAIRCVVYDKDVLRLPSVADHYRVGGRGTALVDATMLSQNDLDLQPEKYGDHAFLTYVLTDGQENCSCRWDARALRTRLEELRDNRTVACLVPDQRGVFEAKSFGFPADNITVWDASRTRGVEEAFSATIRRATESFMAGRARGVRGSKTLFAGGVDVVNTSTVRAGRGLRPLPRDAYELYTVNRDYDLAIRPHVAHATGRAYRTGSAFYELTKPEKIQPQKVIMVRNRRSGRVYAGPDARELLGLPDHEVRVRPEENPEFQVFVQSTSVNRKLVPGTKLLVLA